MIRAILEGRKVMTRRVMKPQPANCMPLPGYIRWRGGLNWRLEGDDIVNACPYGIPGDDSLWVRETWNVAPIAIHYQADNNFKSFPSEPRLLDYESTPGWRPSIFMPRWASRLTLAVTGVRVERVQDISEVDIQAEGTPEPFLPPNGWNDHIKWRSSFRTLWDEINGKRPGCGWSDNPWVWVVSFKRKD